MLPARRHAIAAATKRWTAIRRQHDRTAAQTVAAAPGSVPEHPEATAGSSSMSASDKLFADAVEEERQERTKGSRDHLRQTQGPIWDGDESRADAVLRMLVDAHKPLRSGTGVKHNASDEKIKGWMKNLKMEPRANMLPSAAAEGGTSQSADASTAADFASTELDPAPVSPHRTTIPPHLHRPWHATYTGDNQIVDVPNIRYGTFIKKRSDASQLQNLLELQLPPGADGKTRAKAKEARRSGKMVRRLDNARESALDYRLGVNSAEVIDAGEDEETFRGNRQIRGQSVLGAQKGGISGVKAWAGLAEERIQRARDAGLLKPTVGLGKPIPRDPEASNPHLETGELLMNRIVKRQGALPAWIELQNDLDAAVNSFRATLMRTYTTHLVRMIISTNTLNPLPPLHSVPGRDEAWEAREFKFHQENIKQINDLVRRMNAQAPNVARRGLYVLEMELDKVRGDVLRNEVWNEVKRRAEEQFQARPSSSSTSASSSPFYFESEGLSKLSSVARRSLWTLAHPVQAVTGKARAGGIGSSDRAGTSGGADASPEADTASSPKLSGFVVAGLGVAAVVYFRRPTQNDSGKTMPLQNLNDEDETPDIPSTNVRTPAESTYSPIRIIKVYIIEPILTFCRFLHLAVLFGPVILTAPMLLIGKTHRRRPGKPVAEDEESWGAVWWYGFLVRQMERAGPSFTKLGQWAASRADLFPAALCQLMSKLHSNGDPHSMSHTRRAIERAFGVRFEDVFEEFDETPIGCGAIAQVYRAKLRPEMTRGDPQTAKRLSEDDDLEISQSVAIKVIHPRVRQKVRRDIAIMSVFAHILNLLPGAEWLSLPDEVAVFGDMMNSQLDLRVEASNLDRFDKNFRKRGPRVTFPRPIRLGGGRQEREESREVLIEEFEDALPLKYFLSNGGGPFDDKIANIGLDAFLEMLLLDNWTHGDLHPGNIMVRFIKPHTADYFQPLLNRFWKTEPESHSRSIPLESKSATELVHSLTAIAHKPDEWLERLDELSSQGYEPQLIFIDAGLVTSLDDTNRRNFLDLFQAVAEFDGYKAGKLMIERCRTPEFAIDEETFALKIQHLVLSVKSKTFSLAKIKISDILTDVLTAVRQHHVKLEGDFVNTVISILLLEGIGRQLDPNMDLFKSALPILRQLGRQMGTREAIAAVPKGNIWAMIKLWVWVEAREVAGAASTLDDWIKYDRLMPAI